MLTETTAYTTLESGRDVFAVYLHGGRMGLHDDYDEALDQYHELNLAADATGEATPAEILDWRTGSLA